MVVGDIGLNGKSVLCLVKELIKEELEYAITQLLNLAVLIVLSMALLLLKINDVMKARVLVRLFYLFLIIQSFNINLRNSQFYRIENPNDFLFRNKLGISYGRWNM